MKLNTFEAPTKNNSGRAILSIVTPIYNGEQFIEECLKSVIYQQCSPIEHIIADGGSSDKTIEVVKSYAERYSHIRWCSEPDKGQSDAMNKGIAMAKGDIIGILNADDFYEPDVLNQVVKLFESLPNPTFLVANCKHINTNNTIIRLNKPRYCQFYDLLLGFDINRHPSNPSAYFYHASLHDKVGWYDLEDHYAMDLDFILRAVQVANVKYINEIWGNFRVHEESKTVKQVASGTNKPRREKIIENYRSKLSKPQRIFLKIDLFFFNLNPKLWYLVRQPSIFFGKFSAKLKRMRGIHRSPSVSQS